MDKSAKASMRAESARQTQVAILESATPLFVLQGYKATSIEQIAQAAGIAKGTIYIYYKSKKSLFRACCQVSVDEFLRHIDELLELSWESESECVESVLLAKFLYFHDVMSRSPDGKELLQTSLTIGEDIYAKGDVGFMERVCEAVQRALTAGEVSMERYNESVSGLALLFVAGCHGVEVGLSPEKYKKMLQKMIAVIWRAYAP